MNHTAVAFTHFLNQAVATESSEEQMLAVKECGTSLVHGMLGPLREQTLSALDDEFARGHSNIRRLRTIEFCSAVLFDKPSLPASDSGRHEFLWIFAVPFTVTFTPEALGNAANSLNKTVDASAILSELENSGYFNQSGALRASSALFKREDLQALGPRTITDLFLKSEIARHDYVQPIPLVLDPELDAYRTVTLFMLTACRLPAGQLSVFNREIPWPREFLEAVVGASLNSQGMTVESVKSGMPRSLSDLLFRCHGPAAQELLSNLENSLKAYGPVPVSIQFETPGYAEIVGELEDGTVFTLIPPFSYFETDGELVAVVKQLCEQAGLPFKAGVRSILHKASSALH